MEYCGPIGLQYSKFLSWSTDDQDHAIAWMLHKGQRCEQCGTFPDEWMDSELGIPLDPPPYMAGAVICLGCATLDDYRKYIPDDRLSQHRLHLKPFRYEEPNSEVEPSELD